MRQGSKQTGDRLSERMAMRWAKLSPGLRTVLSFIDNNRSSVLSLSALEIAAETETSDATVIRAVQALGFEGLRDLKATLKTSMTGVMSSADKMAVTTEDLNDDLNATIDYVIESHMDAARHLADTRNRAAIIEAVEVLKEARRIAVFGIGASGILADYATRLFFRNGYPAYTLNRTGIALGEQLLSMQEGDVMIMMAQASPHREGVTALDEADRLGIPTILLTASTSAAFLDRAKVTVIAPRGRADRVPLHGAVLMCLETIILGLAAASPERSTGSLDRLHNFYGSIRKKTRKP